MKSRVSLKLGHVSLTIRFLGQEKDFNTLKVTFYVQSSIFMNQLKQNIGFYNISAMFKNKNVPSN